MWVNIKPGIGLCPFALASHFGSCPIFDHRSHMRLRPVGPLGASHGEVLCFQHAGEFGRRAPGPRGPGSHAVAGLVVGFFSGDLWTCSLSKLATIFHGPKR